MLHGRQLGHQSREADLFGVGKSADVSQFTDHHLGGHESHTWSCLDDRSGFLLAFGAFLIKALIFLITLSSRAS